MIQRLRQMPLQHHQVDIARLIVCHEAFSKFAEGRVLNFFARLPHQFEIKMEVMQRDQTQTQNLFRLDEMTDVAARGFPARGASAAPRPPSVRRIMGRASPHAGEQLPN